MSHVLLVVAHPRPTSLTSQVAARVRRHLRAAGRTIDYLDLYAEDFDPRMTPDDEPDWNDPHQTYSPHVREHMRRIDAADHIVVVFPVWWSAPPAILKGWIERTWTHGFAYTPTGSNLTVRAMTWIALAGTSKATAAATGLDDLIDRQLRVEVSDFCRIPRSSVHLIHDTTAAGEPGAIAAVWRTVDAVTHRLIED